MTDQFEKDKACYEQNCESFRSLNQIMWQVPLIAMTLTGGLWFGVSNFVDAHPWIRVALMTLASIGNFALCVVLWRIRYIIGEYLEKIRAFNEKAFVSASGDGAFSRPKVVIRSFMVMLVSAGIISSLFVANDAWQYVFADDDKCEISTEEQ